MMKITVRNVIVHMKNDLNSTIQITDNTKQRVQVLKRNNIRHVWWKWRRVLILWSFTEALDEIMRERNNNNKTQELDIN